MKKKLALVLMITLVLGLVGCTSKKEKESETNSGTEYENESESSEALGMDDAKYWDSVELNREPYDFGDAEFKEPDEAALELEGELEQVFSEKQLVDTRDFRINVEGVEYSGNTTYVTVSVFNKCPVKIVAFTDLVVNGTTNGFLSATVDEGGYQVVRVAVDNNILKMTGSDKIESMRAGVITVQYIDSNISDDEVVYYATVDTELNTGAGEAGDFKVPEGMQEVFSDDKCEVWVSAAKRDWAGEEVSGLVAVVHNKSKDLSIALGVNSEECEIMPNFCYANADSWGYTFFDVEAKEGEEVSGTFKADLELMLWMGDLERGMTSEYLVDLARAIKLN